MTSMPMIESIREMSRRGLSNAEIQRRTGISQPTIRKYIAMDDFSPQAPSLQSRPSILDPYKPFVDEILLGDQRVWRKQRHSAKRIYERLLDETAYDGGYGTVKNYVRRRKAEISAASDCYMELVWAPGEAQADFGDVDVLAGGERVRMHFLVLSFPFSNMGFCQLFAGETSECVCQGLRDIFEHIGCVPTRIVFDNATGAGRRRGQSVTEADLFRRMKAHYGFEATYANPRAGNEKGNVERKVYWCRQHLFTPAPSVDDIELFNAELLSRCSGSGSNRHYEKGLTWSELFERDRSAMPPLPAKPFSCMRFVTGVSVDKRGDATVDGGHRYHVGHRQASGTVTAVYGAHTVAFADAAGEIVAEHARRFGAAKNGPEAVSQLALLVRKPGAWRNSAVRAAMPADVRAHVDALESAARKDLIVCMRRWCRESSVEDVGAAISEVLASTGRARPSDVEMMLARMGGFGLGTEPDVGPDLTVYDRMLGGDAA